MRDGSGRGLDCEKWKNKHVQANLCLTINGRDAQKLNFLPRPVNCFFHSSGIYCPRRGHSRDEATSRIKVTRETSHLFWILSTPWPHPRWRRPSRSYSKRCHNSKVRWRTPNLTTDQQYCSSMLKISTRQHRWPRRRQPPRRCPQAKPRPQTWPWEVTRAWRHHNYVGT